MAVTPTTSGYVLNSSSASFVLTATLATTDTHLVVFIGAAGSSGHATFGVNTVTAGGNNMLRAYASPWENPLGGGDWYVLTSPPSGTVVMTCTRQAGGYAPVIAAYQAFSGGDIQTTGVWDRLTCTSTTSAAYVRVATITSETDGYTISALGATTSFAQASTRSLYQTQTIIVDDADGRALVLGVRAGAASVEHAWDLDADASSRLAYAWYGSIAPMTTGGGGGADGEPATAATWAAIQLESAFVGATINADMITRYTSLYQDMTDNDYSTFTSEAEVIAYIVEMVNRWRANVQLNADVLTRTAILLGQLNAYTPSTDGGGGGGDETDWSEEGPNAPGGLTFPNSEYLGADMPQLNRYSGGAVDEYGMSGLISQSYAMQTVAAADSPSGSALRINFPSITGTYGGWWGSSDWGGAAPARMSMCLGLADSGRKPKTLYVHMWRRYSANWTQANAVVATQTIYDVGTSTSGTSATQIVDSTKSWITNEHVGRFVRYGAGQRGIRIASNNGTTLLFADGHNIGGDYTGVTFQIVTTGSAGSVGSNAGTKGPFWPRMKADFSWSGEDPKSGTYATNDNHFAGGWDNPDSGTGNDATGEGWSPQVQMQNNVCWDGVSLSGGYPIWTGSNFGAHPSKTRTADQNVLIKEEFILQMNTPGEANGKFRYYRDGVLVTSSDTVPYAQEFYRAASINAAMVPTVGGSPRNDAPLTVDDVYWDYAFCDMTYGGGLRVPVDDMYHEYLAWSFGVSDEYLLGAP